MTVDSGSIGVLILAGGQSSRMNYPKPWLYLTGGSTFLEKIEKSYRIAGVENVVVVLNKEFGTGRWRSKLKRIDKRTKVILNSEAEKGRFHSLLLGLESLQKCDFVFVQNVDSPLVDYCTILELITNRNKKCVVQPSFKGKNGHPILIPSSIGKHLLEGEFEGETLRDALAPFDKRKVEIEDKYVLMNVNTFDTYLEMKNEFV